MTQPSFEYLERERVLTDGTNKYPVITPTEQWEREVRGRKDLKEGVEFSIEWVVKTESYQGDNISVFKTYKEAEKKYLEWSKYDGQLQSFAYPPSAVAYPILPVQEQVKGGDEGEITVEQGNSLIAEFDGWKKREDFVNSNKEVYPWWEKFENGKVVKTHHHDILKGERQNEWGSYHSSWFWLMPVVEKIQEMGYTVNIYGEPNKGLSAWSYCDILKDDVFIWQGVWEKSKIKTTWQAVIEFIKWLNSDQEPDRSVASKADSSTNPD